MLHIALACGLKMICCDILAREVPTPKTPLMDPRSRPISSRISADHIRLKRAYEPPASDDGIRILIDRLWPRGVKKSDAAIDEWMKEIAPSTKLRKWFSHDPERWQEFRRRYQTEIRHHPDEFERLRTLAQRGRITLVFSAHDEAYNDAVVLKDLLLERT